MAGEGEAAGSAPEVGHQHPDKTRYIYCNYSYYYIIDGSTVIKMTVWFAHDCGFKPNLSIVLPFDFHVHRREIVHARHVSAIYIV
jgi:hypothetical protein